MVGSGGWLDHRATPVGRVVDALDVAPTLQPIQHAGDSAGGQVGRFSEAAGGHPRLSDHELKAAQVGWVHAQSLGEGVFVGRIAQDLTDAI